MAEVDATSKETGSTIQLSAEKEAEYERITRNLAELTSGEVIRSVLDEGRTVKCYWGRSAVCPTMNSRLIPLRNGYNRKT